MPTLPLNYAPPDYLGYFQAGQQAVQNTIGQYDAAAQTVWQQQLRQQQLAAAKQKAELDALLAPGEVALQRNQITAGQQSNDFNSSANPLRLQDLGNQNAIGNVNRLFALPDARQRLLSDQIANASNLRNVGPATVQNPDGSTTVIRNGSALPGYDSSLQGDLPTDPSAANPSLITPRATGYHPVNPGDPNYKMEGGHLDAQGNPISTLDDYRSGKSAYVTAAIDRNSPLFGKTVFSPSLNAPVKLSDTGSAFTGKGNSRIDIARDTAAGANSDENNRPIQLDLGSTVTPSGIMAQGSTGIVSPQTVAVAPAPVTNANPVADVLSTAGQNATQAAQNYIAPSQPSGFSIPLHAYKLAPGYINPSTGAPVQSAAVGPNRLVSIPQGNPEAISALNSARVAGTDPTPFIHNDQLDVAGLEAAAGQKAQRLAIQALQAEADRTGTDTAKFRAAALAVAKLKGNLSKPLDQRTTDDDNSAENLALGIELPGQVAGEGARKSFLGASSLGDKASTLWSQLPGTGNARTLSNNRVSHIASTVEQSFRDSLPLYQARMNELRSQAQAQGINPDLVFPPEQESVYLNAGQGLTGSVGGGKASSAPNAPTANTASVASTSLKTPSADTLAAARATIAQTGNRAAVIAKLQAAHFDTSGL